MERILTKLRYVRSPKVRGTAEEGGECLILDFVTQYG